MKAISITCLITFVLFIGCGRNSADENKQPVQEVSVAKPIPTSFNGMIKYYYKLQADPKFPDVFIYDRYSFYRKYSPEILKSLKLRDSLITNNIGVALYTYSIGPISYNGSLWFRNFDGIWRICVSQYFSEYSDDPFNDGMPERAKEIIKKVNNWEKANKNAWWQ